MFGVDAAGLLVLVLMLLFWAAVIALVVLVIRRFSRPVEQGKDAESILEERFARGEIDAEEFEARRKVLGASRARG